MSERILRGWWALACISNERPATEKEAANWLPSPVGDFRPVMRMYEPDPTILNGQYTFPAITRRA